MPVAVARTVPGPPRKIEKWVSELHENYTDSTVSTIFAMFSMIMNAG